jgi:hypothetical protein
VGATVTWTTDEPADSQVEYGTTTAYGSLTVLDPNLITAHSQVLSPLKASTLYHYRVKSRDAAGNLAVSGDFTFTTLAGVDASLIAHLKLDEGSGTIAADSSGNGNAGTLMNGAAWAAGHSGQAAALDGVDDHVHIPHVAALDAYPLTVAVWFKTSTKGLKGLVNKYVAGSLNGYQVFFENGNLCAWYFRTPPTTSTMAAIAPWRRPGTTTGCGIKRYSWSTPWAGGCTWTGCRRAAGPGRGWPARPPRSRR